jgi:hypothetical protein
VSTFAEDLTPKPLSQTPPDVARMLLHGEHLLFSVRKHIFGVVIIYLWVLGIVASLLVIGYLSGPTVVGTVSDGTYRLILAGFVVAVALMAIILLVATYVYRLSFLVVTDKNLIQVTQHGLFTRHVARFTMEDVEDVTANQRGIFATLLNYGTLTVQTAGTQDNFNFTYCPDPNRYAKEIIAASHSKQDSA